MFVILTDTRPSICIKIDSKVCIKTSALLQNMVFIIVVPDIEYARSVMGEGHGLWLCVWGGGRVSVDTA